MLNTYLLHKAFTSTIKIQILSVKKAIEMASKHPHYTNSKILVENQELQRVSDETHSTCSLRFNLAGITEHKQEGSCMP